jgi:hypothetical protein
MARGLSKHLESLRMFHRIRCKYQVTSHIWNIAWEHSIQWIRTYILQQRPVQTVDQTGYRLHVTIQVLFTVTEHSIRWIRIYILQQRPVQTVDQTGYMLQVTINDLFMVWEHSIRWIRINYLHFSIFSSSPDKCTRNRKDVNCGNWTEQYGLVCNLLSPITLFWGYAVA